MCPNSVFLFIVHILKVCLVFHFSFFSDVCDYAWNKEANKGSVVPDSGAALEITRVGLHWAGSWILSNTLLSQTQGKTTVATQSGAWCCGALLGGHRKGSETNSPFCGMSFCQFHDPLYHQKMSPGSHGEDTVQEPLLTGDLGPAASIPLYPVASSVKWWWRSYSYYKFAVGSKWADTSEALGLVPRHIRHSRKASICDCCWCYLLLSTKVGTY